MSSRRRAFSACQRGGDSCRNMITMVSERPDGLELQSSSVLRDDERETGASFNWAKRLDG